MKIPADGNSDAKARSSHGFTLMELLVVVAVIGILAAMLLPAVATAKDKGVRTKCLSNLRQFSYGLIIYGNENQDKMPDMNNAGHWAWDLPFFVSSVLNQDRNIMYDPGYSAQNCDGLWNFQPSGPAAYRVIGYAMTFPNTASVTPTNQNSTINGNGLPQGTSPSDRVVVAGATISEPLQDDPTPSARTGYTYIHIQGGYQAPGWPGHQCCHFTTQRIPAGDNVAMMDGRVKWVNFMSMLPRTSDPGSPVFWW